MCYSAETATLIKLKYALHRGDAIEVEQLRLNLDQLQMFNKPNYHVSGFDHPELLVFTNEAPMKPQAFTWGLIPAWSKSLVDAKKAWNRTLNARGETIFEKPSFRASAKNKRCLIYLDGFFEHHDFNDKKYPFRIVMKDRSPMVIAGLWEEWTNITTGEVYQTTTMVTTTANLLMARIHNNPKLPEPRMPVILTKEKQDEWLIDCKTEADKKHIETLIKPLDESLMEAYTVARLLGKDAIGNVKEVENEVKYPELIF